MIYKTLLTLTGCCLLILCFAQSDDAAMEIGSKKMNLHVTQQSKNYKSKFNFSFVYDSMYEVKLPRLVWKSDTSTQIDPVSQEEITVINVDSTLRVHSYLGVATKKEISDAIAGGFNLSKNCECTMNSVDLWILTDAGLPVHIDYSKPEQLQNAQKLIESLPKNSMIILSVVNFKCPDNQNGMDDESFENLAMVRVGE